MILKEIVAKLENIQPLSFNESFEIAKTASLLLGDTEFDMQSEGRKIVVNVLGNWNNIHEGTHDIWTDVVENAGFYPYLQKENQTLCLKSQSGKIRKAFHYSDYLIDKVFHLEQKRLLETFNTGKNIIVSAPTSFGKSLLIEEIIASKKYHNIIVIQPTLALLDETRRKLLKYNDEYKLIVRTSQEPSKDKNNIFLFTAERVNEYQFFNEVNFLVIDEFYKLSGKRDDERSSSLNNAFHYLLKTFSPRFYLLGPNIDDISKGFAEQYNALFFKSNYSLVDTQTIDYYKLIQEKTNSKKVTKKIKEEYLFNLLLSLDTEQTIIYCSSPNRVRTVAKRFAEFLHEKYEGNKNINVPLLEWIERYVHKEWSVVSTIRNGIGIHDGALQKHITTSIIDYFNKGHLKYLFCTSTIIEGVNTSAKNIIYYDKSKGPNPVDYFDYSNIKGRAGRMMEHYVGKIYNFNPPPPNELIHIDIPFFEQNPIKDEVLIQLNEGEVKDKTSKQYREINKIPYQERDVIKKNGVSVHGQKSIIDILRRDILKDSELICWNSKPTYKQLTYLINLAWNHLLVEGETTRPMTEKKLVKVTFDYGFKQDINILIRNNFDFLREQSKLASKTDAEIMDTAIQDSFQIMKHWFQYKVPKWLSVMNELQKYVCSELGLRAGSYTYYANLIENDFLRENLTILFEYGIPSSAIRKLERHIPPGMNQDDILKEIKKKRIYEKSEFLEYEKIKLFENLD